MEQISQPTRSFASDNNAGIHPDVLKAVARANAGHAVGYGDDPYTRAAIAKFKRHFGADIEVLIVFNGTAANCLSLKALTESYNAVICTNTAHIHTDECGAGAGVEVDHLRADPTLNETLRKPPHDAVAATVH